MYAILQALHMVKYEPLFLKATNQTMVFIDLTKKVILTYKNLQEYREDYWFCGTAMFDNLSLLLPTLWNILYLQYLY